MPYLCVKDEVMKKKRTSPKPRYYLEKLRKKSDNKEYGYWWITKRWWDGKKRRYVKTENIYKLPEEIVSLLGTDRLKRYLSIASDKGYDWKWALKQCGEELSSCEKLERIISTGSVYVLYRLAQRLFPHRFSSPLWQIILLLVAMRVKKPMSKLATARWIEEIKSLLPILGIEVSVSVDNIYKAMDWLNTRWKHIVESFGDKYGKPSKLVLFDVTSLWVEGSKIGLAEFGYSRDGRSGKKQVIVGMICDEGGNGIDVNVFKGNTSDATVFRQWISVQLEAHGIREVVMIGDWAMLPPVEQYRLKKAGIKFIGRVSRSEIRRMDRQNKGDNVVRKTLRRDLWDDEIQEVVDEKGNRLVLVMSTYRRGREWRKLLRNLRRLHDELKGVYMKVKEGKLKEKEKIERAVWETLGYRRPYKNFFIIEIDEGRFDYCLNRELMEEKVKYMGIWGLRTNIEEGEMDSEGVVDSYKTLFNVERSFRYLKTTLLRVRPIYHRLDDRILAHVRICLLALNLARHLLSLWKDLFDKYNGSGRDWNLSFEQALPDFDTCQNALHILKTLYLFKIY